MFNWLDYLIRNLVENVFKISMETHLGESIHFFFYDVIKILILLSIMIFIISYIRTYFSTERTKHILEKIGGIKANFMASILGIVTPFCSCSSVPLFIGFVEAQIPLGVTFSFLITSPIVNEAAFVILLGAFGWKIASIYVLSGVILGTLGGIIIGKLGMEDQVEEYVYQISTGEVKEEKHTQRKRIKIAALAAKDIVQNIWLYLLIGIGIGALIHGWAPEALLSKYAGPGNPLAVIVAVILGVPLYSNAFGTIPIAQALITKGVGIGTALSFMMAVTALSFPAMVLLRKVIKKKLIAAFVSVTTVGIIIIGYLFNFLL
ncbi:MAG: permease [Fusobacteriota bacterium]